MEKRVKNKKKAYNNNCKKCSRWKKKELKLKKEFKEKDVKEHVKRKKEEDMGNCGSDA